MLFVHFTPLKNIKHIKKKGIKPNKGRIGLFPMLRSMKRMINVWTEYYWWVKGDIISKSKMAEAVVKLPLMKKLNLEIGQVPK